MSSLIETSSNLGEEGGLEPPILSEEILLPTLLPDNVMAEGPDFLENDPMCDVALESNLLPSTDLFNSTPNLTKRVTLQTLTDELFRGTGQVNNELPEDVFDPVVSSEPVVIQEPLKDTVSKVEETEVIAEKQCRVCLNKDDLVSLFKLIDKQTIADMLMSICPFVKIISKDPLPQFICNPCLDNVTIAIQLKEQCEKTEKNLRKILSENRRKSKKSSSNTVVINESKTMEKPRVHTLPDLSYLLSSTEACLDDSDDSDYGSQKKKTAKTSVRRRKRRRKGASNKANLKKKKLVTKSEEKADEEESIPIIFLEDEDQQENSGQTTIEISPMGSKDEQLFSCNDCQQLFKRALSLKLHRKVHEFREPLKCEVCGREFKVKGAYRTHLEKHRNEPNGHNCTKCSSIFATKAELRRHNSEDHGDGGLVYECSKCKRTFVTPTRLAKHQANSCPGLLDTSKQKRNDLESLSLGKDLFKTVAPLTTTYWSDSFSD